MRNQETVRLWWDIFEGTFCDECPNKPKSKSKIYNAEKIWPAPFYRGIHYGKENRVLFIAQNPGWPHFKVINANIKITHPDESYIRIQRELENSRGKDFNTIMNHYEWELRVDPIWRGIVKSGLKVNLQDIAFTNLVKCPTEDNSSPAVVLYDYCMRNILIKELKNLTPKYIVFIGKAIITKEGNIHKKYSDIFQVVDWDYLEHTSRSNHAERNRLRVTNNQIFKAIGKWI